MAGEIEELEKESAASAEEQFRLSALDSRISFLSDSFDSKVDEFDVAFGELEENFSDLEEDLKPTSLQVFKEEIARRLYPLDKSDTGSITREVLPGVGAKERDRFNLSGVINIDTTNTQVAGSAGATNLNSFTFFGNEWHPGMTVRVSVRGVYTTDDASSTVALALRMGSTTYHTITTTAATVTNAPWIINWVFTVVTLGSSGTAESSASARTNNVNKDTVASSAVAIATTTNQALTIQATWTSGSAGDTITVHQFLIEILN